MAKCLVCGAPHAACGPSTVATVIPVDERVALRREDGVMADLKRYNVDVPRRNGPPATTTLLLSAEDARAQGLTEKDLAGKAAPTNKAAAPGANKRSRKPAAKKPAASAPAPAEPAIEQQDSQPSAD